MYSISIYLRTSDTQVSSDLIVYIYLTCVVVVVVVLFLLLPHLHGACEYTTPATTTEPPPTTTSPVLSSCWGPASSNAPPYCVTRTRDSTDNIVNVYENRALASGPT